MWVATAILAIFLAATLLWYGFEFFWNRRLFGHTSGEEFTHNIRAKQAVELLNRNPQILPVDVRPEPSFRSSHIPKAVNAPFAGGEFDATPLDSTDRATPLLVYCDGGYRSRKALPHLRKLGFKSIYHLHRGILSWKLRGQRCESDTTG